MGGFLLIVAILTAGCTDDPTGDLGDDMLNEISDVLVPADSSVGKNWVFWREVDDIDLTKGGYLMQRPNLNQKYFKNLNVEMNTDAPVDVRFVTLKQSDEYHKAWSAYYSQKTASSFSPEEIGYVAYHPAVSGGSVEAHGDENIVIIIELTGSNTAKGSMKMYYTP